MRVASVPEGDVIFGMGAKEKIGASPGRGKAGAPSCFSGWHTWPSRALAATAQEMFLTPALCVSSESECLSGEGSLLPHPTCGPQQFSVAPQLGSEWWRATTTGRNATQADTVCRYNPDIWKERVVDDLSSDGGTETSEIEVTFWRGLTA